MAFEGEFQIGTDGPIAEFEILFRAMDKPKDVRNLLSLQLTGFWMNEARESTRGVMLAAWARTGRYPNDPRIGTCTHRWQIMDTNPPPEEHWWYDLAEIEHPKGFKFYRQPGGITWLGEEFFPRYEVNKTAENIENLPANYYEENAEGADEDYIRVQLGGEYGYIKSGKPVVPGFRQHLHVRPIDALPTVPLSLGYDIGGGTLSPACIIGHRHPRGNWLILGEISGDNIGTDAFTDEIHAYLSEHFKDHPLGDGWADPAGARPDEIFETVIIDHVVSKGLPCRPAPGNNSIKTRVEALTSVFGRLIDGEPAILVHPRCKLLIKALAGRYAYKKKNTGGGEEQFNDEPDKTHPWSDLADGLEYLLLGGGEFRAIQGRNHRRSSGTRVAKTDFNVFGTVLSR